MNVKVNESWWKAGGGRMRMMIRIIFSIRMRMRIKVDDQLRTNLILILPLHPAAGRSR